MSQTHSTGRIAPNPWHRICSAESNAQSVLDRPERIVTDPRYLS